METNEEKSGIAVHIETYGCQMNKYDSEVIAGILQNEGYRKVEHPDSADVILINTCSVREHAENRALGRADVLSGWKKERPDRKLGIIGCVAQRLGSDLLRSRPYLDFIVGPDAYQRLPEIIGNGIHGPHAVTPCNPEETYDTVRPVRTPGICGWISIARGCDNFCSYCIVPYTRGRERSRPADRILEEIEDMVRQGFREVTLLGQNVNSYDDGATDFAGLLDRVSRIPDLPRIRFMTSHPKDFTQEILDVMAARETVCPHIHLPVQAGSNRVLQRMNRRYTREHYLSLVRAARETVPGVSLTSDVMVGFPGETETDFRETLDLMREVRFDEAYTYRYSPREGTKAVEFNDEIPEQERLRRLDAVIRLQREISKEIKQALVGQKHQVLPEAVSKKSKDEWMGRTLTNHVVVIPASDADLGQPVDVIIESLQGSTLRGRVINAFTNQGGTDVDR